MKFFEIVKGCFKPKAFFSKLPDETVSKPLGYYSLWYLLTCVIYLPLAIIGMFFASGVLGGMPGGMEISPIMIPILFLLVVLGYYLLFIVGMFIATGIVHLILKLVGAKKTFAKTYQIMIYSMTPNFLYSIAAIPIVLLSLIPIVGFLVSLLTIPISIGVAVYSMFLRIYGFAKAHKISYLKAAVPDIVGIVLGIGIFIIYIVGVIAIVASQAAM